MYSLWRTLITSLRITALLIAAPVIADDVALTAEQHDFFEAKIRPVLAEQCYSCHNSSETAEGGLVLDHRTALRKGGQSGTPLDFKTVDKSLLLRVLRHEIETLEMPQGAERLAPETIRDFERWIAGGAPDPRLDPPVVSTNAPPAGWEATLAERKAWWSFQPIRQPDIPQVANSDWSANPIDHFILEKLEAANLTPAPVADRRTLIRRLSYVLRGLPPTPGEIEQFLNDKSPTAYPDLVERFLNTPAFGEHWARHWMDLIRYAESHGSEGDPAIPHAWKYRDYLIRLFNEDIPYDQFLREQIAGDLLPVPRINPTLHINESAIGPAQLRMCFHGFAPTDALDEKVRFTDDQINVVTKAFLGLTVSCARCHNHKFDPISQADYYALFGIFGSTRPGIVDINPLSIQQQHADELNLLKVAIREELATSWLALNEQLPARFSQLVQETPATEREKPAHLFYPFHLLKSNPNALQKLTETTRRPLEEGLPQGSFYWNLAQQDDHAEWFSHGNGTARVVALPGELTIQHTLPLSEDALGALLPGGVYSHLHSTKQRNIFSSPRMQLAGEYDAWLRVVGEGQALVRYVVQNYPRSGTVYPVTTLTDGKWRWQKYDLTYWNGEEIHLELTTAADSAVLAKDVERSWFGVQEVIVAPKGSFQPPADTLAYAGLFTFLRDKTPQNETELVERYVSAIIEAVIAWRNDSLNNDQQLLLENVRQLGLLRLSAESTGHLRQLIQQYQQLESQIALPQRVPGVLEADATDQALYIRGNHRLPGVDIPRRFLEALDTTPYRTKQSGRLELANDLVREDNPLTSRVVVNRLWHYLFGSGLVRTVDNFGRLGEEPSHPELLDHLALRMQANHWSMKSMIRELLLTKTWQLDSRSSSLAAQVDPDNRLFSHAHLRRLDAESLRDSLLQVSGRIDRTMFGPPVENATANPRRSVYLSLFRNSLNPFLETFDAPVPFATKGNRDSTNVPAQSLTLLNDPFVIAAASSFAKRIDQELAPQQRIEQIFIIALGRPPEEQESSAAMNYLVRLRRQYSIESRIREQLQQQLAIQNSSIESIRKSVRDRLLANKKVPNVHVSSSIAPLAEWRFDIDARDSVGEFHGQLKGNARIEQGALLLDGNSYMASKPLNRDLHTKTLEAVVQLTNLSQRGGGVLTVQDLAGNDFDSIVFAEQQPQHWLAGSNNFHRTQSFQGEIEKEAVEIPVHLVVTYAADGTIQCFRNGVPYGQPYRSSGPQNFKAGQVQVLLGLRHGSPAGNRLLQGKILLARLYDRSLQPDEVAALASGTTTFVSDRELTAALSSEQATMIALASREIESLTTRLQSLGPEVAENQEWSDFAHALFNLKEFLYLR